MQRVSRTILAFALAATTLLAAAVASASGVAPVLAIGEITLVLGKAEVKRAGGAVVPATVGLPVHVNDLIETNARGHVHVHFVDDALVSVRPQSRLEILRYDYDPARPAESAVKMNLIEGETHAISGEAAKAARQNYRMNTPIAAIGVRGTDYTVTASREAVTAIVNEGAIVVAPFSSGCSADTLGPCNQGAVELNGYSRELLALSADAAGVRSTLLPLGPVEGRAAELQTAPSPEPQATAKQAEGQQLYNDTVSTRTVNTKLASSSESAKAPAAPTPLAPTPVPVTPAPPPVPEFTPPVAVPATTLASQGQLVWGRWTENNLANERISVSYDVARQDGRSVSVGNTVYALFRASGSETVFKPTLGVLQFSLQKAQALYSTAGRTDLMGVSGGKLQLDFEQALFSTTLQLSHEALGNYQFATSGRIYSGGVFHANNETQAMAGALSYDNKEAGYFFERTLPGGTISGITLWNRAP